MSQNYEIIVFTASEEGYADPIIDSIDPEGAYISHRFYRHHCIEVDHNLYIKDLRVLGQRPQDKTCIVDNAIHSYFMNLRNGIPVIPFMQDRNDDQLPKLADFLMAVDCQNDIRTVIDKHFNYDAFMSVEDPKAFLGQIEQPRYS